MADIQFDEEQQFQRSPESEQKPLFIRLVLATGVVSTERAAQYVLLGIASVAIIFALVIPFAFGGNSGGKPPVPVVPMPSNLQ